jgi:hypothetical protein
MVSVNITEHVMLIIIIVVLIDKPPKNYFVNDFCLNFKLKVNTIRVVILKFLHFIDSLCAIELRLVVK